MRDAFIASLCESAARDERVMWLSADLGFKLVDGFARQFPGRFLNMGVCEANMVSVAAGLALEGKRPFTYSIAPFATARCLEQIRDDVCGMKLPVVVVGIGAGYAYGPNGPTHHGLDDIALLRSQPGMTVVCPCDPRETRAAVPALLALGQPAYLRLGRGREPLLAGTEADFVLGRPNVLRQGRRISLAATGSVAAEALGAAELLALAGIDPWVVSVHTVKPIEQAARMLGAMEVDAVVTVEEHFAHGGLGEALTAALAGAASPRVHRFHAPEEFLHTAGSQESLRRMAGLDAGSIAARVRDLLGGSAC